MSQTEYNVGLIPESRTVSAKQMQNPVQQVTNQELLRSSRVGIYLGSMSGPGSGAWTWFIALLTKLSERTEIQLMVFGPIDFLNEIEVFKNVNYVVLPHRKMMGKKRIAPIVHKLVAENQLDALHFFTLPIPAKVMCTVIYTLHDLRSHYPKDIGGGTWRDFPRRTALKFIKSKVDYVVTTSEWSKRDICAKLKVSHEKIIVVPQILELEKLHGVAMAISTNEMERYVLALGHIEVRKNLGVLIRAAQSDFWPQNVVLRIVGRDLGELQNLKKLHYENVKNTVQFQSHVSDHEKWNLIRGATVITVPSFIEGYGILTAEGVSSGIPVLVSDQSALPEVIGVEEAIISAHKFEDWAKIIRRLCSDQSFHDMISNMEMTHLRKSQAQDHVSVLVSAYLRNLN